MINKISNITLSNDNGLNRISVMYDVFDDEGRTVSVNNRISRIVTDETINSNITTINDFVNTIIEEV